MSISLRIHYRSPEREHHFIPVAAQAYFKETWLPACYELGLELIPLFSTGYPVIELNKETIPPVIHELKRLRDYFLERYSVNGVPPDVVARRLDVIIPALEQAFENFDEIEYVRV